MTKLLLHTCCAPCMVAVYDELEKENKYEITSFFYNNNIHPKVEYELRLKTLEDYTKSIGVKLIVEGKYDMVDFVKHIVKNDITKKRKKMCILLQVKA